MLTKQTVKKGMIVSVEVLRYNSLVGKFVDSFNIDEVDKIIAKELRHKYYFKW